MYFKSQRFIFIMAGKTTSKGQSNLLPLHIETLSPQLHGFIRAYVRQLERRSEPQIEDEPGQQTALQVARTILRVVSDRYESSKLVAELGDYLRGAVQAGAVSTTFQRLIVELRGGTDTEALSVPTPPGSPAAPPAAPEAPAAPPTPVAPPAPVAPPVAPPAPAEQAAATAGDEPEPPPAPLADAPAESPSPSPTEEREDMVIPSTKPGSLPHQPHSSSASPDAESLSEEDVLPTRSHESDGVETEENVQS